ncbi:bacterio-opsin activator domain-containing protein [Halolamina litorea]|uniref:Bacterio-opsin activator domain-containing protein n=1 Tax=Halolamina litorea TaxID=1515593 RepID=A0ABD6BV87_9EURY|nr:bacterio-opsin activator domain-containing protein [Halolamina litorea]
MSEDQSVFQDAAVLVAGSEPWMPAFVAALEEQTSASVHRAATAADAKARFRADEFCCVVGAKTVGETDGVTFLAELQEETAAFPTVLATDDGSERLASSAVSAGITDYVPIEDPVDDAVDDLVERTRRAVWSARRTATRRERAQQFEAVFQDTRAATWVLDDGGRLSRVNKAAREMVDEPVDALVGELFSELPWWEGEPSLSADVAALVERGLNGGFGDAVVVGAEDADDPRILELSVHPVENARGEVVSVVVEGIDVSQRVRLDRDLRQSEQLHRATLKYMTDTVLMTDEDGSYVYVCPNVHFIFGYSAAEIHDQQPVEELLGEDLFDREELASKGVLKNIETTVTDKTGQEHTLLVNVREVSIQDGRILYTCRDITERKQREEALATLQATAREFLYAETPPAIAQHVVDDTPGVLNLDSSAVYLFDAETNTLELSSSSERMAQLHNPAKRVAASADDPVSQCFVENEARFFEDVHDAAAFGDPTSGLHQVGYAPLGDHGVFVFGSDTAGPFDDITRELADLLAATAEAAFDRVSRESTLRTQERELTRRNEQLHSLNRINEIIREIDQAIVQAETREEVEHMVCRLLAAEDRFTFAWVGSPDVTSAHVEPRSWDGREEGYLNGPAFRIEGEGVEPAGRAVATGQPAVVDNVAEGLRTESWRKAALSRDYLSVISIPLTYNDLSYGALTVYADEQQAFDDRTKDVLTELGETIASAISAVERKNALLSTSMTRVTFEVDDPQFVLSKIARETGSTLVYQGGVRRHAEGNDVFVTVNDGDPVAVEATAADLVAIRDVRRISTEGAETVLRLRFSERFLAVELAEHGAVFRSAKATPTETTVVIDAPESVDVRRVSRLVRERFDGVQLLSKQRLDQSAERDLYSRFLEKLTDRQFEVVQTAYYGGYFESPRASSGEEVASTLGISSTAFYQHVRTVQRKLFATLFEEVGATVAE